MKEVASGCVEVLWRGEKYRLQTAEVSETQTEGERAVLVQSLPCTLPEQELIDLVYRRCFDAQASSLAFVKEAPPLDQAEQRSRPLCCVAVCNTEAVACSMSLHDTPLTPLEEETRIKVSLLDVTSDRVADMVTQVEQIAGEGECAICGSAGSSSKRGVSGRGQSESGSQAKVVRSCQHVCHVSCVDERGECPTCAKEGAAKDELLSCDVCKVTSSLWMCLSCGAVGCGRYENGHALTHALVSGHRFGREIGAARVWDYQRDSFVQRLVVTEEGGAVVREQVKELHASGERRGEEQEDAGGEGDAEMGRGVSLEDEIRISEVYAHYHQQLHRQTAEVEQAQAADVSRRRENVTKLQMEREKQGAILDTMKAKLKDAKARTAKLSTREDKAREQHAFLVSLTTAMKENLAQSEEEKTASKKKRDKSIAEARRKRAEAESSLQLAMTKIEEM